VNVYKQRNTY